MSNSRPPSLYGTFSDPPFWALSYEIMTDPPSVVINSPRPLVDK